QFRKEVFGPVEVVDLEVHGPEFSKSVSIRAGPPCGAKDLTQILSTAVGLVVRAGVEDLHDVDQIRQLLNGVLAQVSAELVIGMLEVNEAPLLLDFDGSLPRAKSGRNPSIEEQTDELAVGRRDLLAHDNSTIKFYLEAKGSNRRVVIGNEHRSQP